MVAKKRPRQVEEDGGGQNDEPTLQRKSAVKSFKPDPLKVVASGAFSGCEDLDTVKKAFSKYGEVTHVQKLWKGKLVLTFETQEAARAALELNGMIKWEDQPVELWLDKGYSKKLPSKGNMEDNGKKKSGDGEDKPTLTAVVASGAFSKREDYAAVRKAFSQYGKVKNVRFLRKGRLLLKFPTEHAARATLKLNGQIRWGDKPVELRLDKPLLKKLPSKGNMNDNEKNKKKEKSGDEEDKPTLKVIAKRMADPPTLKVIAKRMAAPSTLKVIAKRMAAPSTLKVIAKRMAAPARKKERTMGNDESANPVVDTVPASKKQKMMDKEDVEKKDFAVKADADYVPARRKKRSRRKKAD